MGDIIHTWISRLVKAVFVDVISIQKIEESFQDHTVIKSIHSFISEDTPSFLYFHIDLNCNIRIQKNIESVLEQTDEKSICLYIAKVDPVHISSTGNPSFLSAGLQHGIFLCNEQFILSELKTVSEEIFFKFILDQEKQNQVTRHTLNNAISAINDFTSNLYKIKGQFIEGKINLPLPPTTVLERWNIQEQLEDEQVELVEKYAIMWIDQIDILLNIQFSQVSAPYSHLYDRTILDDEIHFWSFKAFVLTNIFHELQSNNIRPVLNLLDKTKSKHNIRFARICKRVFWERDKAKSNKRLLGSILPHSKGIHKSRDLMGVKEALKSIFHLFLLVWKTSVYYNNVACLVRFVDKLANITVEKCCDYFSDSKFMNYLETAQYEKAIDKLEDIIEVYGGFKSIYFFYKNKSEDENPDNSWGKVSDGILLVHLEASLKRCHELRELMVYEKKYQILKNISVSGPKGSMLTKAILYAYNNFRDNLFLLSSLHKREKMQIMKVNKDGRFERFFYSMRTLRRKLDNQVKIFFLRGIKDSPTFLQEIELVRCLLPLMEMPDLNKTCETRMENWIKLIHSDMHKLSKEFEKMDSHSLIYAKNLMLRQFQIGRISDPFDRLKRIDSKIFRLPSQDLIQEIVTFEGSQVEFENYTTGIIRSLLKAVNIDHCMYSPVLLSFSLQCKENDKRKQLILPTKSILDIERLRMEIKYSKILHLELASSTKNIIEFIDSISPQIKTVQQFCQSYNQGAEDSDMLHIFLPEIKQKSITISILAYIQNPQNMNLQYRGLKRSPDEFLKFVTDCELSTKMLINCSSYLLQNFKKVDELLYCDALSLFECPKISCHSPEFMSYLEASMNFKIRRLKSNYDEGVQMVKQILTNLTFSDTIMKKCITFMNIKIGKALEEVVVTSLNKLMENLLEEKSASFMINIELHLTEKSAFFNFGNLYEPLSKSYSFLIRRITNQVLHIGNKIQRLYLSKNNVKRTGSFSQDLQFSQRILTLISKIEHKIKTDQGKIEEFQERMWTLEHLWNKNHRTSFFEFLKSVTSNESIEVKGFERGDFVTCSERLDLKAYDKKLREQLDSLQKIFSFQNFARFGCMSINIKPWLRKIERRVAKGVTLYTSFLQATVFEVCFLLMSFFDHLSKWLGQEKCLEIITEVDKRKCSKKAIVLVEMNVDKIPELVKYTFQVIEILRSHDIVCDNIDLGVLKVKEFLDGSYFQWRKLITISFREKEKITLESRI